MQLLLLGSEFKIPNIPVTEKLRYYRYILSILAVLVVCTFASPANTAAGVQNHCPKLLLAWSQDAKIPNIEIL